MEFDWTIDNSTSIKSTLSHMLITCHEKFGPGRPGVKFGSRSKFCNKKAAKLIPSWQYFDPRLSYCNNLAKRMAYLI